MNKNPIQSINGNTIKCPSQYDPAWEDVSKSTAGRTEDGIMHPEKIGTTRAYSMQWQNISFDEASSVLKTIAPLRIGETFSATVFDLELGEKANDYFITKTFYVGNRASTVYNMQLEICTITFKIISVGVS